MRRDGCGNLSGEHCINLLITVILVFFFGFTTSHYLFIFSDEIKVSVVFHTV